MAENTSWGMVQTCAVRRAVALRNSVSESDSRGTSVKSFPACRTGSLSLNSGSSREGESAFADGEMSIGGNSFDASKSVL